MRFRTAVRCLPFLLAASSAAFSSTEPGASNPPATRQTFVILADSTRIGTAHREWATQDGSRVYREFQSIEILQLRRRSRIEAGVEVLRNGSGLLTSIAVWSAAGMERSAWGGTASSERGALRISANGGGSGAEITLGPDVILPDELPAFVESFRTSGRSTADFRYLSPAVAAVVVGKAARQPSQAADATVIELRFEVPGGGQERWEFAPGGSVRRISRQMLGTNLVFEPCETGCNEPVQEPFDLISGLVVDSPNRIPPSAMRGPIRYVMSRTDGLPATLPVSSEQAVTMDGGRAVVTVCTTCAALETLSDDDRQLYLTGNRWVSSHDPAVAAFAARHRSAGQTPLQNMRQLTRAVTRRMNGKADYLGYATASEALRTRSGDCTEFAVLLAAVARASGIPARVVTGLAYTDRFSGKKNVFSPHAWVQAWTGERWQSFDAGLGHFDATHIALAIGDGDPRQASMTASSRPWRIEKTGLVRESPEDRPGD